MSRRRASRRRRRLRLAAVGVVVVGLVALGIWLVAGRAVVPGVTAQLNPIKYKSEITRVADKYEVDPYLVAAVARTESNFNPQAVSKVGAVGRIHVQ